MIITMMTFFAKTFSSSFVGVLVFVDAWLHFGISAAILYMGSISSDGFESWETKVWLSFFGAFLTRCLFLPEVKF